MNRPTPLLYAAPLLCVALVVGCGSKKRTASALESDGTTVIYEEVCARKKFVKCGKRVREKAKAMLCENKGVGRHDFLYKIGTAKPIKNMAICK